MAKVKGHMKHGCAHPHINRAHKQSTGSESQAQLGAQALATRFRVFKVPLVNTTDHALMWTIIGLCLG